MCGRPVDLATASLGVFNAEGQNASVNRDSTVLVVGRLVVRPLPEVTVGGDVAAFGSDRTRYSGDLSIEWRGLLARGEVVNQHADVRRRDDLGWYALAGMRVLRGCRWWPGRRTSSGPRSASRAA